MLWSVMVMLESHFSFHALFPYQYYFLIIFSNADNDNDDTIIIYIMNLSKDESDMILSLYTIIISVITYYNSCIVLCF